MDIDPNNLQKLIQRQIFQDITEGGVINLRIMLSLIQISHSSVLDDKHKQEVFQLIHVTALKLTAVWQHMDRFKKLESELVAKGQANPIDDSKNEPIRFDNPQALYLEFDGFLVQFKSTLDHMIHILHFTFGLPFEALSTFGDYGNHVRKILKANVGKPNKQPAAQLAAFIEKNQDWLKGVIDLRDRMNHYKGGGIGLDSFTVYVRRKVDGIIEVHTPRFVEEQGVLELMKITFDNLLEFVEHFMGFAMIPKLKKFGLNWQNTDDPKKPRWNMVPLAVIQQLHPQHFPWTEGK